MVLLRDVGEAKWTPPTGTEEVEEYALRLG